MIFLCHSLNVSIICYVDQLLRVSICLPNSIVFLCTFIYAKYNHVDKWSLWADLVTISCSVSGPWFVGADFNVVLSASKYLGTISFFLPSNEFGEWYPIAAFVALFIGSMFIWCRPTLTPISKRLDRGYG